MAKTSGPSPVLSEADTHVVVAGDRPITRRGRPQVEWRRGLARAGRLFWNNKVAAAHTVFYLISAAIFLPLVAGMFLFMQDTADAPPDPSRGLDSRARSILHQLTMTPGLADSEETTYWEKQAEIASISEIGIRDENTSMLSYSKIDNLQRGGLVTKSDDPFLNYGEMRDALRLDPDINFHIRMSPVILNPGNDPYGTKPLAGMHVAYVAGLSDDGLGLGNYMEDHQFPNLSPQAVKEMAALETLGLQTDAGNPNNGFDGKFYQPLNLDPTLYQQLLLANGYTNLAVQQGDVIADTERQYRDALTGGTLKTYNQWFWDSYFTKGDGSFRYDAIIFGGGVDLTNWDDHPDVLLEFVKQGGVLVFMGGDASAEGLVHDCQAAHEDRCLLWPTGSQAAPTTPDDTNQMLFVPNKLTTSKYGDLGGTWEICKEGKAPSEDNLKNELLGFIPIIADIPDPGDCANTAFGATSADRYGGTGGTVILTQWDTTATPTTDVSKMFANLLSYGLLRPVYLDYGPEIPVDAPVVTAERLNMVQFPTGEYMDVKLRLYMWRGACGGLALGCATP